MTVKEIRDITGLSQSQFAEKYNIPVRTIQCWESENKANHRECPAYVRELLEFKVKFDMDKIM